MNAKEDVLTATFGVYLFVRYVYRRYCLSNVLETFKSNFPRNTTHLFLSAAAFVVVLSPRDTCARRIKFYYFILFFPYSRVPFSSSDFYTFCNITKMHNAPRSSSLPLLSRCVLRTLVKI